MLVASTERNFYGGVYYPQIFDPESLLSHVAKTVDVNQTHSLNPFTDEPLPGPKRYFIDKHTYGNDYETLRSSLLHICEAVGFQMLRPTVTVVIYEPKAVLPPHNDSTEFATQSLLLTLQGSGHYDTFANTGENFVQDCMDGIYPKEVTASVEVGPGDAVLSHGSVIHGFRNNDQKRIVLGVLED